MITINGKTKVYGIIGNPVSHSLSPAMHNSGFTTLGENRVYVPFHVENLAEAIAGIKELSIQGASVTIPHKEDIIPYLDRVDPVAHKIGAVNTLHVEVEDGKKLLCGSNTDWIGANRALLEKTILKNKKVVLLGAGGSARAIGFGLQEEGAQVVLCSRTESRGKALAKDLDCDWYSLNALSALQGDILVNATSVGMNEDKSPVPVEILQEYSVVMDIVYSPLHTRLIRLAKEAGCETVNGLEMLLFQGVAQFELWTGQPAPISVMREVVRKSTGNG